jgi:hypothetical protein
VSSLGGKELNHFEELSKQSGKWSMVTDQLYKVRSSKCSWWCHCSSTHTTSPPSPRPVALAPPA